MHSLAVAVGFGLIACLAPGRGAAQAPGRIDAPAVTATATVAEALVGHWVGHFYVADARTDFSRVDVSFLFTDHGVVRVTRPPFGAYGVFHGQPFNGFANYMVFGDSIMLSMHGTGHPILFTGARVTGDRLEFVLPDDDSRGYLAKGGFILTRQP